jgi:hypothetical protein
MGAPNVFRSMLRTWASRTIAAALALVIGLGAGDVLREHREGASVSAPREAPDGQALAAPSATPVMTAAPDCVVLGRIASSPAPPLSITDLGTGYQRVTSAEGGYSIDFPSSWLVSPGFFTTPQFGRIHVTSYDPKTFSQQRQAVPTMLSPDVGIAFDVELFANPKGETPDVFAKNLIHEHPDGLALLPGSYVTVGGTHAYHAAIQDEHRYQPTTGPLQVTRQTRLIWIVPTTRADRYITIVAAPGESPLSGHVEEAVRDMKLTAPVVSHMPVIHQRGEIASRWLYGKSGPIPGRRIEAKLMRYADASAAMNGGTSTVLRLDRDPDELFWLVAVSGGTDLPQPRGGLIRPGSAPPATPAPTTWILYDAPATNDRGEMTGTAISHTGTWPPGFDALPDLCH